ncbi:MAG: GntR family transcriptional regulator [Lachnospiraceae bacterium]|nr:GntR family transcriptional regulator [Lachnospiraceae bacterium]
MLIDYQDSRPIYEQIVEHYKKLILKGAMVPDEQMPSVRSLAVELATNPNTVQKAMAELERQGFVYTVKGRGSFVADNRMLVGAKRDEIVSTILLLMHEAEEIGLKQEDIRAAVLDGLKEAEKGNTKEIQI